MVMNRRQRDGVELWCQLTALTNQVGQALDKQLTQEHGIGMSEVLSLMTLRDGNPRGARVQELAEAIGLNQSSMSRLTARLEAKNLVERVVCEYDRRGVFCAITEAGRDRVERALETFSVELTKALDVAAFESRTASVVARLRYDANAVTG
ncbi:MULTISPECIES: MarR family winged helix-turn-helix transcriptional regulator [Amycolatopsis]|uniref:MarR family winged helix-turn-helix transcriptional regulator n=1 Tax=Amycolatopsis sp. MJM2582 TaxID=1427749 RepID=UPI00068ECC18|nr:MarR family transcriptional regulator [Amycolatopsis sp. MJM2582]